MYLTKVLSQILLDKGHTVKHESEHRKVTKIF